MHRINSPTAVQDVYGPGKNGYTDGDPLAGIPPTYLNAAMFAAFQEECCRVVEAAGLVLDKNDLAQLLAAIRRLASPPIGHCRLSVASPTQLRLMPHGGSRIPIAGIGYPIPAAGVTLGNGGLAASTLYYVYAVISGGAVALECSATGHAVDTTAGNVGVEIKAGDPSRTLVGMIYTSASGQFEDAVAARHCINWFNRRNISSVVALTPSLTFSNVAAMAEVSTTLRASFLTWADEAVSIVQSGTISQSATSQVKTQICVDTVAGTFGPEQATAIQATFTAPFGSAGAGLLAEGRHFSVSAAAVGTNGGTGTVNNIQIDVQIRG